MSVFVDETYQERVVRAVLCLREVSLSSGTQQPICNRLKEWTEFSFVLRNY